MKIVIGADHAGFEMKEQIKKYIEEKGHTVYDVGTFSIDRCDYPKIAYKASLEVKNGNADLGVLICGTGIGMSIASNKIKKIKAVVVSDSYSARLSRLHNNANVLCFGARVIGIETAKDIVDNFLEAEFLGDKHLERINMIKDIEEESFNID